MEAFLIGPPIEGTDRKIEGSTVIAVATVHDGQVRLPIVEIEQADWVDEVHFSRKGGDSANGYVIHFPLST